MQKFFELFLKAMNNSMKRGETFRIFIKKFGSTVIRYKIDIEDEDLEKIFNLYVRLIRLKDRFYSMIENVDNRPYWLYEVPSHLTNYDSAHKNLDNKVFKYDDIFWKTNFPPNSLDCKCDVMALNEYNLKEKGLKIEKGTDLKVADVDFSFDIAKISQKDINNLIWKILNDSLNTPELLEPNL